MSTTTTAEWTHPTPQHSPQHLLCTRLYDLVLRADFQAAPIQRLHCELCAAQSFRQADPLAEDQVIALPPAGPRRQRACARQHADRQTGKDTTLSASYVAARRPLAPN